MNDMDEMGSLLPQPAQQPMELEKVAAPSAMTSQQMRVMEVNECLAPAYAKASTLDITDAEIDALMAPFPDSAVEIRPHDGLIYLPHILISDRLNRVFKPGKWTLMRRREWLEGTTMYAEYIMLIRGCFVGESIGGHPYQPNNPKVNYSDTLESTAAEALRRIAGKRLSCGSQVWNPDYARTWVANHAYQQGGKWFKRSTTSQPTQTAQTPANVVPMAPKPTAAAKQAVSETPEQRKARFLKRCLDAANGKSDIITGLFRETGWILETETYEAISANILPKTKGEAENIFDQLTARAGIAAADEVPMDFPATPETAPEPEATVEPWREYPVPFGKSAGIKLGELQKNLLFGFWANFKVETEWNGKPKKPETIAKDRKFREMLDDAGKHYEFKQPDDIVP